MFWSGQAKARKVTVLGTASSESITLTALTLARLMAQQAKVVVVDRGIFADDCGCVDRSGRARACRTDAG